MVSILDYNGADDEFKIVLKHAAEGRALYAKAQTQSAQTGTDVDIVKVQQLPLQQSENKSTLNIQAEAFTRQQFAR